MANWHKTNGSEWSLSCKLFTVSLKDKDFLTPEIKNISTSKKGSNKLNHL